MTTKYNIFRWYKGGWGRYTQVDPLAVQRYVTEPYGYALANPLRNFDPTGLWTTSNKTRPEPGENTIVCDGAGRVVPHIDIRDPLQRLCLTHCARLHEETHARDANQQSPGVCRGQPAGVMVFASNRDERNASEFHAWDIFTKCLETEVGRRPRDDYQRQRSECCRSEWERQLEHAREQRWLYDQVRPR